MKKKNDPVTVDRHDPNREIVRLINKASRGGYSMWQVWDDFVYMAAAELSQIIDFRQEREDEYIRRGKTYNKDTLQLWPEILGALVMALESVYATGFADVLGDAYMKLELNNHWKGQFFTPYHVCKMMALMSIGDSKAPTAIEKYGFVSINDPCCGAGGMLIAGAEALRDNNINYQQDALFVGQDLDPVCALMCYVQMSLLGMPGIVQIGNSLTMEYHDTWYTPMYLLRRYKFRRFWAGEEEAAATVGESVAPPIEELREDDGGLCKIILPQPILNEKTGQYSLF